MYMYYTAVAKYPADFNSGRPPPAGKVRCLAAASAERHHAEGMAEKQTCMPHEHSDYTIALRIGFIVRFTIVLMRLRGH